MKNSIVICGPTASGKTALAVFLARNYNGEIVSADSRQVFKGMDIGTGKDISEYGIGQNRVAAHCIDLANPQNIFTLYHYQKACYDAWNKITSQKKLPIICGGTGLYIEAMLNYYDIPNVPENESFRSTMQLQTITQLKERLKESNPDLFKKTDCSSKKRIIRALEIVEYAKLSTVLWSSNNHPQIDSIIISVCWPKEELVKRIHIRLEERLSNGMIDEVQSLLDKNVSYKRLEMFGMEYRYIARYLSNKISFDLMKQNLEQEIIRMAKRQRTWFRGMERRGFNVHWIDKADKDMAQQIINRYKFG